MGDGIADSEPPRVTTDACDLVEMHERSARCHAATLTEQDRVPAASNLASTSRPPGHAPLFGVGIHEATFRVNVRWVTPLGEDTASMS